MKKLLFLILYPFHTLAFYLSAGLGIPGAEDMTTPKELLELFKGGAI